MSVRPRATTVVMLNARMAGLLLLASCNRRTTLPEIMAGKYARASSAPSVTALFRKPEELLVTATGYSYAGGGGMPQLDLGLEGVRGTLTEDRKSDTFASVTCSPETQCGLRTKEGCEVQIARASDGSLTVIAGGACAAWSGRWVRAQ